jgi:hypothetical protein
MFTLNFETDNAAFENFPEAEIARILDSVRAVVEEGCTSGRVFDINGNKVGTFEFKQYPNPDH